MSDVAAVALQDQEKQLLSIIGDVPLVSIGLMAFGTFTFLTTMRRVSLPDTVLFAASFLVFSAAILDLSKIVAEVRKAVVARVGYRLGIVRDVGLATSIGLVYLFMWLFVAERPRTESQDLLQSLAQLHSGSWRRWNILGEMLKWLSLALSLLTPLLRILWHRLESIHVRDSFLITDATVEVVLSSMFILKLVLNTSLVCHDVRWKALRDYLAPIIAMVISAALSIGNLATISPLENPPAFTDTTIGYFLLSIELYILILFTLMNAFYKDITFAATSISADRKQEPSAIRIQEQTNDVVDEVRRSRTTMVSTWIGPRRTWQDLGLPCIVDRRVSGQAMITAQEGTSPLKLNGLDPSPISALGDFDFDRFHLDSKPLPDLPENDHLPSTPGSSSSPSSGDSSLTTFNKILRHQKNLDKMISKLRTSSPQPGDAGKPSTITDTIDVHHSWKRPSSDASNTIRSPMLVSASDISLSSFPLPPLSEVQTPRQLVGVRRVVDRSRRKARYLRDGINIAASENQGHNHPTFQDDARCEHESAATQYDVTSFIDDLTTPNRASSSMLHPSSPTWHPVEPGKELPTVTVVADKQRSSPYSYSDVTFTLNMPSNLSEFPDYYKLLNITKTASQDEIRQAYKRESLKTHPDRLAKASTEERRIATERFQAIADAYYVLSDPKRRSEYDLLYSTRTEKTDAPGSSRNFFTGMFTASPSTADTQREDAQPDPNGVFADVFDELLRPEVERYAPWWSWIGTACGGGLGFIVANVPGMMLGAYAGNRLGAIRDAKGKSVAAVFSELATVQKAEILRALAMKVLGTAAQTI
ncbi:hypothetical protein APHAL10511_006272 [Amanita phalloides]|nr:hypothetical protein APHAL10511_006272 [Amanita phalloides]